MRIEVMGAFGVHVASIALNGDTVQYLLSRAERFVEAPAEMSLSGLAPVEVAPADLLRLLFDRPLPESEWQCGTDVPRQRARECVHRSSSLRIEWLERDGGKRRLEIESAQASVEMVLREARSNVEVGPEAFQLRPPPGYKVETYRR